MKRERLKKLAVDVSRHFPPPQAPGKITLLKFYSDQLLSDEEVDARVAKIPRRPNEHPIVLNIVRVKRRVEDVVRAPAERSAEERELERRVRELEAKKAELEERACERGKKPVEEDELARRRRRLDELRKAARKKARTI